MQVSCLTASSGCCGADPSAAQDREDCDEGCYLRPSEPCKKEFKPPVTGCPPLDAPPNLSFKGRVFRHFGLPGLENFVEIFHGLFFERFNPCGAQNPRVIFCGCKLRKKLLGRLRKHASPDRFAKPTFSMKPRVLIVDGHSMIFQWPDLTLQHAKRTAVARESLVRMLDRPARQHRLACYRGLRWQRRQTDRGELPARHPGLLFHRRPDRGQQSSSDWRQNIPTATRSRLPRMI